MEEYYEVRWKTNCWSGSFVSEYLAIRCLEIVLLTISFIYEPASKVL